MVICLITIPAYVENVFMVHRVRDSKKLSEAQRQAVRPMIVSHSFNISYSIVEAADIDARRAAGENLNEIQLNESKKLFTSHELWNAFPDRYATRVYMDAIDVIPSRPQAHLLPFVQQFG